MEAVVGGAAAEEHGGFDGIVAGDEVWFAAVWGGIRASARGFAAVGFAAVVRYDEAYGSGEEVEDGGWFGGE